MSVHLNANKILLTKYGNFDLDLISYTQTIDPNNPTSTINISTPEQMLSYKGRYKSSEVDGEIIRKDDIKLYVDPSTISTVPKISDKVREGTDYYTIKNVYQWQHKDTIILYVLQLRS